MLAHNKTEYELVRQEMGRTRTCITHYMGFTLAGSVGAAFGVPATAQGALEELEIAALCLAVSLIVTFISLILLYKFNSYNRFAGYCKLLNHERLGADNRGDHPEEVLLWEICISYLRRTDQSIAALDGIFSALNVDEFDSTDLLLLRKLNEKYHALYRHGRALVGLRTLVLTALGRLCTASWAYPAYLGVLLAMITAGFLACGVIASALYFRDQVAVLSLTGMTSQPDASVLVVCALGTFGLQAFIWRAYLQKFGQLIDGAGTVDSYFWRFLPIRARVLGLDNLKPRYLEAASRLREIIGPIALPGV
jgi:hypothetical protein